MQSTRQRAEAARRTVSRGSAPPGPRASAAVPAPSGRAPGGSGESLNVSVWCGFSPNARQIRLTALWLIPVAAAIDRVDQCVAFAGRSSSVFTITRSTCSSLIVRGFPVAAARHAARPAGA